MRRSHALLALGLTVLLLAAWAGAVPASAASSSPVLIEAPTPFGGDGTFTATGDAVCSSGTTSEVSSFGTGSDRSRAFTFHVVKTFACDDGSGTVTVRLDAVVRPCSPTDLGSWVVVGGTEQYAGLRGAGTLVGTYFPGDACSAEGVVDRLSGMMVTR